MRVLLLTVLAFAALTATAHAHHQIDDSRWWFGGSTFEHAEDTGGRVDPVNLFFYPGWFGKAEIDEHFNDHIGQPAREPNEFIEHNNMITQLMCRTDQWIRYREEGSTFEFVQTDLHGALVEDGPADCANRYHIRMWGDARHEVLTGTTHSADEAWIVGAAHYEELGEEGHRPDLDWDTVEHRIARWMRPHYYHLRWKCLPNSWGLYQNFRSDGRISRISINSGQGDVTPATDENGQC